MCVHSRVKTDANIWENSRAHQFRSIHLLENSLKLCRGFHQAMEARKTCFISFVRLIFSVLTKGKTIYEARMYALTFMKL